jgi:large subunit ribosomal protein L15
MTELHDLKPPAGSHRDRKRKGKGPGSGLGKTAGRGHKGQKARSGGQVARGFEGGQMPLQRRIPKRGFTPLSRVEYQVVNVRVLEELEAAEVTPQVLADVGLIGSAKKPVKILGDGELSRKVSVSAHAFSRTAKEKIEGAGGSVSELED